MKIDSSNIQLSSQHSTVEKHSVSKSVRILAENQRPDSAGQEPSAPAKTAPVVDTVTLSDMARMSQPVGKTEVKIEGEEFPLTPEMRILKLIVEKMLGIEVDLSSLEIPQNDGEGAAENIPTQMAKPGTDPEQGGGMEYDEDGSAGTVQQVDLII